MTQHDEALDYNGLLDDDDDIDACPDCGAEHGDEHEDGCEYAGEDEDSDDD